MTQVAPQQQNGERESMVVSGDDMHSALKRMAHEIVERNGEGCDIVVAGIPTRGVPLATRLAAILNEWGTARASVLELGVEGHRDDRETTAPSSGASTGDMPSSSDGTESAAPPEGRYRRR